MVRPRSSARATLSGALAALIVASALVVGGATRPAAAVDKAAFFVGDSIFAGMSPQYTNSLATAFAGSGWTTTLDAEVGRTTSQGTTVVTARRGEIRDLAIVMLGNNDGANPSIYGPRVDAMMSALSGVSTVMWLTMTTLPQANDVIRQAAAKYGTARLQIVDWASFSAGNPSWFQADGLHPTSTGSAQLAGLLRRTTDAWFAAKQAASTCRASTNPPAAPSTASGDGYWLLDSSGRVWPFGPVRSYGDLHTAGGTARPVALEATPSGKGYWILDALGKVWAFGDAGSSGDLTTIRLNSPVRGLEASPRGGYWLVGGDGGVFTFGTQFFGSTGGIRLNSPVISMATADGLGYWLVAGDGGVFTFGDARFFGSTGGTRLNAPVISMTVHPSGLGYWLYAKDGGVFTFGPSATFRGSVPGIGLCTAPTTIAMRASATGDGYWVAATNGDVFAFGDAFDYGDRPPLATGVTIVDLAIG